MSEEQGSAGQGAAPRGWYPDPETRDGSVLRYWDGAAWTKRYRNAESGKPPDPRLTIAGVVAVLVVGALAALTRPDADYDSVSEQIGYGLGVLVLAGIVFLIRLVCVKLFARDRPVWAPWVLFVAAGLGLLLVVSNASQSS